MARTGFIQNELDLKLLVLYIMSRTAAPVTFNQLLDVALCDAGVDYFSLTEVVGHLVETGHLEQTGQVYAITEKGRRNSEICESSLPYSVRMHCDENLGKLNGALKRAAQVQTGVEPHPDGTCTVRLFFADDGGPLMELKFLYPSQEKGRALAERFQETPEAFYHDLMTFLSEERKKEQPLYETKRPGTGSCLCL